MPLSEPSEPSPDDTCATCMGTHMPRAVHCAAPPHKCTQCSCAGFAYGGRGSRARTNEILRNSNMPELPALD